LIDYLKIGEYAEAERLKKIILPLLPEGSEEFEMINIAFQRYPMVKIITEYKKANETDDIIAKCDLIKNFFSNEFISTASVEESSVALMTGFEYQRVRQFFDLILNDDNDEVKKILATSIKYNLHSLYDEYLTPPLFCYFDLITQTLIRLLDSENEDVQLAALEAIEVFSNYLFSPQGENPPFLVRSNYGFTDVFSVFLKIHSHFFNISTGIYAIQLEPFLGHLDFANQYIDALIALIPNSSKDINILIAKILAKLGVNSKDAETALESLKEEFPEVPEFNEYLRELREVNIPIIENMLDRHLYLLAELEEMYKQGVVRLDVNRFTQALGELASIWVIYGDERARDGLIAFSDLFKLFTSISMPMFGEFEEKILRLLIFRPDEKTKEKFLERYTDTKNSPRGTEEHNLADVIKLAFSLDAWIEKFPDLITFLSEELIGPKYSKCPYDFLVALSLLKHGSEEEKERAVKVIEAFFWTYKYDYIIPFDPVYLFPELQD
jgi:tetratricopeptide (TPR) repeat protein